MDRKENSGIQVYAMECSLLAGEEAFDRGLARIGSVLAERVHMCRNEADRRRRLAAYILLERAFSGWKPFGQNRCLAGELYRRTEGGKPYLEGNTEFQFNLSHSGDCAVCAFGNVPVGVDVQERRPLRSDIASRFFSGREAALLKACANEKEREDLFFHLWCAKEACVKLTGQGLAAGIDQLEVFPEEACIRHTGSGAEIRLWQQFFQREGTDYFLAVCLDSVSGETIGDAEKIQIETEWITEL